MTQNPGQSKTQQRVTIRLLFVPVLAAMLVIVLIILALAVPGSFLRLNKWELSIVTDTMTILMVLCPLMLCTIPLYLLLAAAVFGIGKVHHTTENTLKRAHSATSSVADRTENIALSLGKRTIGIAAWFTFFDKLINSQVNSQDRPESDTSNE